MVVPLQQQLLLVLVLWFLLLVSGQDQIEDVAIVIQCKDGFGRFALTADAQNNSVYMGTWNANDAYQKWYFKFRELDVNGSPGFLIVNQGTGKVLYHTKQDYDVVRQKAEACGHDDLWVICGYEAPPNQYYQRLCAFNLLLFLDVYKSYPSHRTELGNQVISAPWNDGDQQLWQLIIL